MGNVTNKYPSLINRHNLVDYFDKLGKLKTDKLLDIEVEVTEKLDGENFRFGVSQSNQLFIGQRNTLYEDLFEKHPHWDNFSWRMIDQLDHVRNVLLNKTKENFGFFGELVGNSIQRRFEWEFKRLNVFYFNVRKNEEYLDPISAKTFVEEMGLDYVPVIGHMTLREALNLDVENILSFV